MKTIYYLWDDVLSDYTTGCIFAFADSIQDIKDMFKKNVSDYYDCFGTYNEILESVPTKMFTNIEVPEKFVKVYWGGM